MTSTIARPEPAHDEVLAQLNRILADARFAASERNSRFLRYVVERTLAGKAAEIKEIVIATELYGRSGDYDPKADSIVRVEASRLRSKLHSYYTEQGAQDPIRITIPKGTYVPQFERRPQEGPPDGVVPANRQEMQQAIKRWPWAALIFVASFPVLWLARGSADLSSPVKQPAPDASVAWQEGNDLLDQDPHAGISDHGMPATLERAIERYEFAVARDQSFARGWASLAEAYEYAMAYVGRDPAEDGRRAEAAARRAIALDGRMAAGHAMLALVLLCARWDFAGAEAEYQRALELDPRNAYAVVEYADLLRETSRVQQAAEVIRKARALQPALPVLAIKESEIQVDLKQADAAIATASAAIRLKQDYGRAYVALGTAWEAKGDFEAAIAPYRKALAINGQDRRALPAYGHLLGRMGRRAEALAVARELEDLNRRVRNCAYQVAVVYAGLDEYEQALDWLERAYRTRQVHVPFAAVDLRFKPLRQHARFRRILAQLALKPVSG